jgi:hypothetical protein
MMQTIIALTIVFAAAAWLTRHFVSGRKNSGPQCGGGTCSCGDDGKSTLAHPKRHRSAAGACSGCAAAASIARPH